MVDGDGLQLGQPPFDGIEPADHPRRWPRPVSTAWATVTP
jgi:hypothetical protein